ncbi:MAG: inner membrane CreD family protein [Coriobacteriia bacterium]
MSGRRLFAVGFIFVLAAAAWIALAGSVQVRTTSSDQRLGSAVGGLWGTAQTQKAPTFAGSDDSAAPEVAESDIKADFKLDQRRKGLLWYATYVVDFDATYGVRNPLATPMNVRMTFEFPDASGLYDGFAVVVDGSEVPVSYSNGSANATFTVSPGQTAKVSTGYRTNGMDRWVYVPSPGGVDVVRQFKLAMSTDFADIDYPSDGVSPTRSTRQGGGWNLEWNYDSVVSGRSIGLVMPTPMNPGPLVARITTFAPVSLLFFFVALILLTATSGVRLHPVHYGFLAAAFFAFDLLLAYLADQIDINLAFAIAAVASVALAVGYLWAVIGKSKALFEIAVSQIVFLVLFSYSFFFTGFTGLAITIGVVLTLAFFMKKTAKVDWETVFAKRERDNFRWPAPVPPYPAPYAETAEKGGGNENPAPRA